MKIYLKKGILPLLNLWINGPDFDSAKAPPPSPTNLGPFCRGSSVHGVGPIHIDSPIHKFPIKRVFQFHLPIPICITPTPSINLSLYCSPNTQNPTNPKMKSELSPTMAALNKETPCFLSRKARYKFWALAAILLLAFWSMFTGSVSLKWSAATFAKLYDGPHKPIFDDLDILVIFLAIFLCGFLFLLLFMVF